MMSQTKSLGRESGQGTIEYILVLLITVIIITSLIYQYNSAFRSYAEAFFGGYVSCLLELGEIPGRSGGVCQMSDFNLSDGKIAMDGSVGEGGAGGASGGANQGEESSSQANNQQSDSQKPESGGESNSGGGRDEAMVTGGGSSPSRPIGSLRNTGRQASTPDGEVEDRKESISAPPSIIGQPTSTRVGTVARSSNRKTPLSGFGYWGQEANEREKEDRPAVASVSSKKESEDSLKPRKAKVDVNRAPAQELEQDGSGFSFGSLLRFLLIGGIIVAIVVFFGGQIIQVTKSWEK